MVIFLFLSLKEEMPDIETPEMRKMREMVKSASLGRFVQNASPEELQKLVNTLKYLTPALKYANKGF